jgi:hypothetical protein
VIISAADTIVSALIINTNDFEEKSFLIAKNKSDTVKSTIA